MDLRNLETFITVAETGSFTKTAQKLGYSQSTISFQIKQLEEQLGVCLFDRINHTIRLTTKGNEILKLSRQVMTLTDDMGKIADKSHPLNGHVRIATADSLCHWLFGDHFKTFHNEFPNISMTVITASTKEMFRMLNKNEVDLGYTLDSHIYDSQYIIAFEKKVDTHFVISTRHPLCQKDSLTLEELLFVPCILTERGMSYRRILEEELASRSLEIRPFLELGDTSLICQLIEQNMGFSLLPDYVTEKSVTQGLIKRLHITDFHPDIWIQLLYHRDKWCSPEMARVIEYLR